MILRDRQKLFVERSVHALRERGNALSIAPTGSGKSLMLSAVVGRVLGSNGSKACVLAHRDEITAQNIEKFLKVNPCMTVSIVDSRVKSWSGKTIFAMVQTLAREKNLQDLPSLEILVIDEAHHAQAATYRKIIDAAKERNPRIKIFGVTATPNRGDGKGLREIFDNCADQITLAEMIASGQLVKPRTFIIDLGVYKDLKGVKKVAEEFDMNEVAAIMDRDPLTEEIVRHWKEKAGDRRTVVFCSTVSHAQHVTEVFQAHGVAAEMVTAETPEDERRAIFNRLDRGKTQMLINIAIAVEGWDCPPVSCVVLLRPCSHKSTFIQMIGRGLRKLDPEHYPGLVKTDCIILDFGASALLHGTLEQEVNLDSREREEGEAPTKECPQCNSLIPWACRQCPFCGHEFVGKEKEKLALGRFEMTEVDLLRRSPFKWCPLSQDSSALMATGFDAWSGVFLHGEQWLSIGGSRGGETKLLAVGEKLSCLASSDDWLNLNETEGTAHKSRGWLRLPPTEKQLNYLPQAYRDLPNLTRYKTACLLTFLFNESAIRRIASNARAQQEVSREA